ncbi:hypothetical protein FLBR109950_09800 [Flavobacterium branchiophilum]
MYQTCGFWKNKTHIKRYHKLRIKNIERNGKSPPLPHESFRVVVKKQEVFLALKKTTGNTFGTPQDY